ncbi:hypothetical protein E2562_023136 [Oryza meyeriana var. granulata]|uniref:Uncharacterized protein n=1 Tax=Oryza meyeriana var. granulata TaxID=110450 RepID=A0A6G1E0L3_9ORYZ|nr:hypothetical protein E2562_023136 [Oryza meyeriana var. granulata]
MKLQPSRARVRQDEKRSSIARSFALLFDGAMAWIYPKDAFSKVAGTLRICHHEVSHVEEDNPNRGAASVRSTS